MDFSLFYHIFKSENTLCHGKLRGRGNVFTVITTATILIHHALIKSVSVYAYASNVFSHDYISFFMSLTD